MAKNLKPEEARRRVLGEWQQWATQQVPAGTIRTRLHVLEFVSFLEAHRAGLLQSLGSEVDATVIHGWLFRNGEVVD